MRFIYDNQIGRSIMTCLRLIRRKEQSLKSPEVRGAFVALNISKACAWAWTCVRRCWGCLADGWWWCREKLAKLNSKLDTNWFVIIGGGISASLLSALLFIAFRKDWPPEWGWDFTWLTTNPWLLGFALFTPPAFGILRRLLRAIESRGDKGRAELCERIAVAQTQLSLETAKDFERYGLGRMSIEELKDEVFHETVRNVAAVFGHIAQSEDAVGIKVILGTVEKGVLTDIKKYRWPTAEPNRSHLNELQDKRSCFSRAIESKRIQVVPDIAREMLLGKKAKFVATHVEPSGGQGSLICFPVVGHNCGSVRYVVSVYSDKKRRFPKGDKAFFERTLKQLTSHLIIVDAIWKKAGEHGTERRKPPGLEHEPALSRFGESRHGPVHETNLQGGGAHEPKGGPG